MSEVVIIGSDEYDLTGRFADAGVRAIRLDGQPIGADLEEAGIDDAGAIVLTEAGLATVISVAKERNPALSVVLYAAGRLPPFASRQADLAVDPQLVDPDDVVDAVVDRLASAS